ncbi:MAG: M42 family metallopeptidase [Chloroflexi bacterium]|nr:M42 family metallopeptidase [Chloroflexota bacterium]
MAIEWDLLKKLCETPGIASRENQVRSVALDALRPLVQEIRIDQLGNAICVKSGKSPVKVMLAGHLDEIGFMVRYIDDAGFLFLQPLGGFDPRVLVAQRVLVHTSSGTLLRGVLMPGIKPAHLMSAEDAQRLRIEEFFVDLGLSKERVQEQVDIGDMVTLDRSFETIGDGFVSKAMDDRIGVFVMIEALRSLQSHKATIIAVATTQEEVGLRGARVSAFGVEPALGVALDVTLALDIPGQDKKESVSRLGAGAAIKIMDSSLISDPRLVERFRSIARREQIPYQIEILPRGGTDAGGIQLSRAGVPSITLSIPTRYVHTVNEMVYRSDVEACINLLAAFLQEAHEVLDVS